jgi:hypothetical protein
LRVPLPSSCTTTSGKRKHRSLSPMGHLQLHKCCETAAIMSSVLDSPQGASLSHYFCAPMLGKDLSGTRIAVRHPATQLAVF